jgi:hypothetical protein
MGIFSLVHIRESEVREMTIKYSKVLAIAGVALLTSMMVAPSHAEDPVVPVATTAVSTMGTIQVISQVNNDNGGTKLPADFTFNVKHFGTDVLGSPFLGTGSFGTTFIVEAGTYVISTPIVDGYDGTWSGIDITNGFIDLQAGQNVTIIRTFNDNGTGPVVVVDEPTTENGGVLPNTATPWFNFLLVGSLVAAAGSFGILKSINLHKVTK